MDRWMKNHGIVVAMVGDEVVVLVITRRILQEIDVWYVGNYFPATTKINGPTKIWAKE